MATNAGVWIDHKQAVVVLITDAGKQVRKTAFDIGQPLLTTGRPSPSNKHTRANFVPEDRRKRKVANDRKDYYGDVLAAVSGAVSLLILGPGEAKGELSKLIKSKKLKGLTVELETADKMTDRQIAAKVSEHFATSPAKKEVAPKKPVKKAAKVNIGKRTKKSGK